MISLPAQVIGEGLPLDAYVKLTLHSPAFGGTVAGFRMLTFVELVGADWVLIAGEEPPLKAPKIATPPKITTKKAATAIINGVTGRFMTEVFYHVTTSLWMYKVKLSYTLGNIIGAVAEW